MDLIKHRESQARFWLIFGAAADWPAWSPQNHPIL